MSRVELREQKEFNLGRSAKCDMVLEGNNISRKHAVILKEGNAWLLRDNDSLNGTYVNQKRLSEEYYLNDGDVIGIGDHEIRYYQGTLTIGEDTREAGPGVQVEHPETVEYPHWFLRVPRLKKELPKETVTIDTPPNRSAKPETNWFSVLASPVTTVVIMVVMVTVTAVAPTMMFFTVPMTILSVVMAVYNHKSQKGKFEKNEKARLEKYGEYLDGIEKKIRELKRKQLLAMQMDSPALAECVKIVETKDTRLWNRRPEDADFLRIRAGYGTCAASFEIKGVKDGFSMEEDELQQRVKAIGEQAKTVDGAPVECGLFENRFVGIIGDRRSAVNLAKNMIVQMTTLHSYEEVKLITMYSKEEEDDWAWVRWLPHSFDEERRFRFLASTARRTDRLLNVLEEALKIRSLADREEGAPLPYFLFVFTQAEQLKDQPITRYLFQSGRDLGAGAVFLFDEMRHLPKECNTIIEVSHNRGSLFQKQNIDNRQNFQLDMLSLHEFDKFARSMAPVRISGGAVETSLPGSITFLEGYGIKKPEEINLERVWGLGSTWQSMAVPIGVKANGEPFLFDIHEKKYGPHGLVAGMTGSGKSEMVQSWILSMALKFSPQDVSFVLIDFKGTGLILPFADLPHLAGTISDLDTKISRNLIALENELSRRKELLDRYGVNNISTYLKLYQTGKVPEPLSFLFIVIDEFAEFKVQFPDFMTVVDRIFAIGRTLGVFAILLTQKPAGVVDDKMNANTRFRWCLKVSSSADSKEMLHHPDAAKITNPGRAYVQVGEDEVYELIQSYYSGAPYLPSGEEQSAEKYRVAVVEEDGRLTYYEGEQEEEHLSDQTEISAIVSYISSYTEGHHLDGARKIWMPKLSDHIYLEEIAEDFGFGDAGWKSVRPDGLKPVVGMIDDPADQSQYPLRFDFTGEGHISIFGAPGTGKTTMLQSTVMSLMLHYTPEEVNLYLMDFGGWSLGIFKDFPHVGGVVYDNDEVRLEKLVQMIERKLLERKTRFSDIGVGSQQAYMQATGEKLPYIVVALDNFAPVLQLYPDLDTFFIQLTREGGNYGIYLLVTANSPMALGFKINQNIKMAVALQMTDRSDYQGIVGKTNGLEPENMEGRGLAKGNPPLEFQAALPAEGKSESERVARIKECAARMRDCWKGGCAAPIPIMPEVIPFGSVRGKGLVTGLSTQFVEPVSLPENRKHYMPVVGTGGSGKSNMILSLARQALSQENAEVVLFTGGQYNNEWAGQERCRSLTEIGELDQYMEELVPLLQERKKQHDEKEERTFAPVYIFIDDYKKAYEEMGEKTAARLSAIIRLGTGLQVNLIIAEDVSTFCRLCEQGETVCMLMARENSGVLLGGNFQSCSVFSGDLSMTERMQALSEYEGYLLTKGKTVRFKAMKAAEQ